MIKKTDRVYGRIKARVVELATKRGTIDATMLTEMERRRATVNLHNFRRLGLLEVVKPGTEGRGGRATVYRLADFNRRERKERRAN